MRAKIFVIFMLMFSAIGASGQPSGFTYQGKLSDMSTPANGTYRMQFALYASATEGGPGIATVTNNAVPVAGGIFTVGLDFGSVEFTNSASRWLEIRVKRSTEPPEAPFIILTPRQEITSAPYSLHADVANGANALTAACVECVTDSHMASVASFKITGTLSDAQVSDNLTINGGLIDNTPIGATTPSSARFVSLTATGGLFLNDGPGTDTIISENQLERNSASTESFSFRNAGSGTLRILVDNTASPSQPSYGFTTDTDTGIYSSGADTLNFSTGGVSRLTASSSGINVASNLSVGGTITGNGSGLTNIVAGDLVAGASVVSDAEVDDNLTINGGTINNTVIGGTIPATATFTTANANIFNATMQYNVGGSRVLTATPTSTSVGIDAGIAAGTSNAFFGNSSGRDNAGGTFNSFFGASSGMRNSTGGNNSFFGALAGDNNTTGGRNSFFGRNAGTSNVAGNDNSFIGYTAGAVSTGDSNSFFGGAAGVASTTGDNNTFVGQSAGDTNTTGSNNTIIGMSADVASNNLTFATAIGAGAVATSSNSVTLGRSTDTVRVPNDLEVAGFASISDAFIGDGQVSRLIINTSASEPGNLPLCLNSVVSRVNTCSSSIRFKENIVPFGKGLDVLRRLSPVAFNWKHGGSSDLGLIAEEVAAAEPLLAIYNESGEPQGVKYDRIGVVLINAVTDQQAQIERQQKQLEAQRTEIEMQRKVIEGLKLLVCKKNSRAQVCRQREDK